jgi:hypothetical protein
VLGVFCLLLVVVLIRFTNGSISKPVVWFGLVGLGNDDDDDRDRTKLVYYYKKQYHGTRSDRLSTGDHCFIHNINNKPRRSLVSFGIIGGTGPTKNGLFVVARSATSTSAQTCVKAIVLLQERRFSWRGASRVVYRVR